MVLKALSARRRGFFLLGRWGNIFDLAELLSNITSMKWVLYSDGASRGNPGEAGAGAYLVNEKGEEIKLTLYLGQKTNNQAEYEALLLGLRELKKYKVKDLTIRADSELLIKQLKGEYRVKHPNLIPLFEEAKKYLASFSALKLEHVRREQNEEADALANLAIDEKDIIF
ncbi:MAG: hypothetical protein A3G32_06590 [Deltaproteobacteria bacterium RIFCSPLOWO2_12_FULL_40_28]|nr:MAG: hypothetical protein A3C45_02685 [Deltaproteobacteria bacterium RIFCSPHIGHO2_02_FULL_40_28]OGQ19115.1 MAG: hypothetical protein A3E27_05775 [Deltaproteobacteria bacterium RIFCSPHIGHO2_12_FULL_40_32]OGQ40287.1 MAG: hypothetical protein A3I69_01215 [Deltaproteobacteria bacterium RIFCSPLOWO2_02_FULL_40_36]OGQ53558.1 MAG: hypothetical protein A3G32_06590 [Deltaproteobacteria bacterium RIFCSPLOWO2_12_FULL_40_28]